MYSFSLRGFLLLRSLAAVGVFKVITAQRRQDFRITPPRSPGASQGGHFLPCRYEPLAFASLKATWEAGP